MDSFYDGHLFKVYINILYKYLFIYTKLNSLQTFGSVDG